MKFETLKERMEYYKSVYNYKLTPNSYVLCHIDGKSFSKKIKKLFKLPFDDMFIDMMNQAAIYACKNIQGCKLAYVQSDEISLVITDFETEDTDSFFSFRLCKMQSIIASLVTSKFQQLFLKRYSFKDDAYDDKYLFQFDCKCWTVPTYNDVFAWLLYRQNDCTRNSKQQTAQTYLSHKKLLGHNTDEQINLLKELNGIDWNDFDNGKKYGRLIFKESELYKTKVNGEDISYERSVWKAHDSVPFTNEYIDQLNIIPKR